MKYEELLEWIFDNKWDLTIGFDQFLE
jgi:hypothetical protein